MPSYLIAALHVIFVSALITRGLASFRHAEPWDRGARVGLALVMALSFVLGPVVDGLEYEDAYIHQAAAKYQAADFGGRTDGFYTKVCMAGAAHDCILEVTYGTHLVGFSVLLALLHTVAPNASSVANAVSAVAATLTLQIVWVVLRRHAGGTAGPVVGTALLLTAPAFHVIGGSGFAEPLFALHFVCFVTLCVRIVAEHTRRLSISEWVLLSSNAFLLVSIKKEGVLLVTPMLALALAVWAGSKWRRAPPSRDLATLAVLCVLVISYAVGVLRIEDAAARHAADIGRASFDVRFAARLLPILFEAAFDVASFGGLWPVLLALSPMAFRARDMAIWGGLAAVGAYVLLYATHARHAAFVAGAAVLPDEMVRYIYVLAPAAAVVCGILVQRSLTQVPRPMWAMRARPTLVLIPLGALVGLCLAEVRWERFALADIERRNRLAPLQTEASNQTVFISPYSVALIARAPATTVVIDERALDDTVVREWLRRQEAEGKRVVHAPAPEP